jgi:hypothetical protein
VGPAQKLGSLRLVVQIDRIAWLEPSAECHIEQFDNTGCLTVFICSFLAILGNKNPRRSLDRLQPTLQRQVRRQRVVDGSVAADEEVVGRQLKRLADVRIHFVVDARIQLHALVLSAC